MSDKAVERAMKLLRLAAPSSGATEPERQSAALEAAKIIAENRLIVTSNAEAERREAERRENERREHARRESAAREGFYEKTRKRRPPPAAWSASDWHGIVAFTDVRCVVCGRVIHSGEQAWFDARQGTRHYDITCDR